MWFDPELWSDDNLDSECAGCPQGDFLPEQLWIMILPAYGRETCMKAMHLTWEHVVSVAPEAGAGKCCLAHRPCVIMKVCMKVPLGPRRKQGRTDIQNAGQFRGYKGHRGSIFLQQASASAIRDFPGGPVAKSPSSQCRGPGFDPWSGN